MAQSQGWDLDAMELPGNGGNAQPLPSSSFTPINRSASGQHPTPPPSASSAPRHEAAGAIRRERKRRRNAAVAGYLGFGNATGPSRLDLAFPPSSDLALPDTPGEPRQERPRAQGSADQAVKAKLCKVPKKQNQVSDDLRIQKPAPSRKAVKQLVTPNDTPEEVFAAPSSVSHNTAAIAPVHPAGVNKREISLQILPAGSSNTTAQDRPFTTPCFAVEETATESCATHGELEIGTTQAQFQNCTVTPQDDIAYSDGLDDDDLLTLTEDPQPAQDVVKCVRTTSLADLLQPIIENSPNAVKDSRVDVSMSNALARLDWPDAGESSLSDISETTPDRTFDPYTSAVMGITESHAQAADGNSFRLIKPIVRPAFPAPVRDRSPVIGLNANKRLRTCFRIGEALNTGCSAVKQGQDLVIELYARILSSTRDDTKQHFVFCDLYHRKPPYIKATYEAAIWRPVELFNYDSGRLLQAGRTCRCIGKMKRNGSAWELMVLNIWEATWEDIEWVEGIIKS